MGAFQPWFIRLEATMAVLALVLLQHSHRHISGSWSFGVGDIGRGPGHIEWIPTDAQSQCINSQLNSRGEPPDYYWLQFRSNTPATNCRGYCMRVIHSCGIY